MEMGRSWGVLWALCALTACGETETNKHASGDTTGTTGSAGFGAGGTGAQGQGGTEPQTQGQAAASQGQGGTLQGQGGTGAQGQGSTSQGLGGNGTIGVTSSSGTGGSAGFAGAVADSGSAGAATACADKCAPCDADQVLVACDPCICEPADSPDKPLIHHLAACPLDEPCPASRRYDTPASSTWQDGLCMLTAFRDRTVGKYEHSTRLNDEGYYMTNYTFLVLGDDKVLILRSTQNGLDPGANIVRTYLPVWSCALKSYELLDSCLEAGTDLSHPSVCDASQDWFETCETAVNPVCPGE